MNLPRTSNVTIIITSLLLLLSCGKDDVTPAKSRDVKFEVTGNFGGKLDATFITSSGGATNESITSLPWTKSINYLSTASGTAITISGVSGVAGQTLTVKIFAGGTLISETPATATSDGIIVIVSPSYVF